MTFLQWRRFNFFDVSKDDQALLPDSPLMQQLKNLPLTCCTSGRGQLVFGDVNGYVHFISRQMEIVSFKAYQLRVTHLVALQQSAIVVSIGEDEAGINPLIKVWNLEKPSTNRDGSPLCTRITRAIPGNRPSQATCLSVHESLTLMAVGFEEGSVLLIRGDVLRERGSKKKVVHQGIPPSPITAVHFQTTPKSTILFIVSMDHVWSMSSTGDENSKLDIDAQGAPSSCIAMADGRYENHLILGKRDAVYCYTTDSRGPCYAFEGEKLNLYYYRGYLVVVSKESAFPGSENREEKSKPLVTIYDLQNKLIAYSAPFSEEIAHIVSEWGDLFMITVSGRMLRLVEKDVRSKLELLFRKNLYDVAITLAKSQHYDAEGLMEIFRLYGDHLYSKGDYSGAIQQYIKAIGRLEAAYVIRKFLDSQRIQELTAYLQSLHKQGLANEDHTTLLLNCYTKLRDTQKLDQFIMRDDREVDFDVGIAIKVCRQSGYYKHALALAQKHHFHSEYLKIQVDDHKDYSEALEYISALDLEEAQEAMKKYGSVLMREEPERATELLKNLCAGSKSAGGSGYRFPPEDYLHLFVCHPEKLKEFLEFVISENSESARSSTLLTKLLELYLQFPSEGKIMEFLKQFWSNLNLEQALLLCQRSGFYPGVLFLYEKAELFREIISFHADKRDFNSVISCSQKFGARESSVWMIALEEIAKCNDVPSNIYSQVLSQIHKRKLSSPLLVLDVLRDSTITLGTLKGYLFNALQAEEAAIDECELLTERYNRETAEMKEEIKRLKEKPTVFQGSKCNACNNLLDLPSVHFLCKHSFHQHCFESYMEGESECPACAPENRKIQEIIRKQEAVSNLNDLFFHQLERAEDPFGVVADYFGRSVFNDVTIIAEDLIEGIKKEPLEKKPKPSSLAATLYSSRAGESEGALRAAEVPSAPISETMGEGRLRVQERAAGRVNAVAAEGRLRIQERTAGRTEVFASEARLRIEEKGGRSGVDQSEAKMRSMEKPVTALKPDPSIGRVILGAAAAGLGHARSASGSLEGLGKKQSSPIASPAGRRPKLDFGHVGSVPVVSSLLKSQNAKPEKEVSYDEAKNPFADEEEDDGNPFKDDDQYDESLNPFSDS